MVNSIREASLAAQVYNDVSPDQTPEETKKVKLGKGNSIYDHMQALAAQRLGIEANGKYTAQQVSAFDALTQATIESSGLKDKDLRKLSDTTELTIDFGKMDEVLGQAGFKPGTPPAGKGFNDGQRLNGAEQRLDGAEQRLDGAEERLDGAEQRLDGAEERLDGAEQRLDGVEERADRTDASIKRFSGLMSAHDKSIEGLRADVDGLDTRVTTLEGYAKEDNERIGKLEDTMNQGPFWALNNLNALIQGTKGFFADMF